MRRFRPTHEPLEKRYALAASLSITGPADAVFEGESLEFTLRLSEASRQVETVFVSTADGTATYGSDYFAMASQQIQFSPGQTMRTVTVRSLRDSGTPVTERVETFSVIARPANPALRTVTAIGRIADFTPPPRLSVSDVSVTEGNSGRTEATFTVALSAASVKAVTVAYATADLSATLADSDYVAASGTLTFAPGETRKTVNVGITGDRKLESNETFSFTLSAPTNADLGQSRAFATIVNDEVDLPGFQISLNYLDPNLKPAWKSEVGRAAATWSRVITGDVPGVTYQGRFIDDFEISVRVEAISPRLLGYARTLESRPGVGGLPFLGEMVMNSLYADQPGFYDTMTHEIAHALGFNPTMWTGMGLSGGTVANPLFLGRNALREFNAAFGRSDLGVPLYNIGQPGDGSYGAHWRDSVFGNELMVSASDPAATNIPLSRITIGQFADIGYTVNYAAANSYSPPSSLSQQAAAAAAVASSSSPMAVTPQTLARPSRPAAQPSAPARPAAPVVATPRPATTPATKPAAPVRAPVVTTAPRPSISVSTSGVRRF